MEWNDLLTALALVLVLEGLGPATGPKYVRRMYAAIQDLDDTQLRIAGLVFMGLGALILYYVN